MDTLTQDLEALAFEGISIDFQFNSDKPTFGDLLLIVDSENPNSLPNSREFKKLNKLGFEQIDDYFGIKNNNDTGDNVKLWLFPIINGEEVYNNEGPFDAIRLTYVVVRNDTNTADLFEKVFKAFSSNLDVTAKYDGKPIESYNAIQRTIRETIQYCEQVLKVEPGSNEAL